MIRAWNSHRFYGTIRQGEPLRRRCSLTAKVNAALSLTRPFLPRGRHTHDLASKTPVLLARFVLGVYPIGSNPFVYAVCRRTVPPVLGLAMRLGLRHTMRLDAASLSPYMRRRQASG
jgi:hypothetical protein